MKKETSNKDYRKIRPMARAIAEKTASSLDYVRKVLSGERVGKTERIVEKRDTTVVVRIDTIIHERVAYRDRWRVRVDTLRVWVGGDSVEVPVPIDKHIFTDDTTYRAEVSGFNVSLDRIEVFRPTIERTVTIDRIVTPPPKRFGIGLQVGYGVCLDGTPRPYIGIGLSYNFIRF